MKNKKGNVLRVKVGNKRAEIRGSAEFIAQEREAFYEYAGNECKGNGFLAIANLTPAPASRKKEPYSKSKESGELTVVTKVKTSGSWKGIADKIKNNCNDLQVGDTVMDQFKDGTVIEWIVTDATEEYVRFESRDCIDSHRINDTHTNKGGIAASEMQRYLNEDVFKNLSDELQGAISEISRKYCDGAEVKEFVTKLFLPSASEVFDKDDCYGEEDLYKQLEFYKNRRNRVRDYRNGGGSADWWLSSPSAGSATSFCVVTTTGGAGNNTAGNAYGVTPCFIIKKS